MYIIFMYYKLGFSFKVMCLCVCILTHSTYNLQLYFSINIGETVA